MKTQAQIIPTEVAVNEAWERYAALCRAVASDPNLVADPDQRRALERAQDRWATAYVAWCQK